MVEYIDRLAQKWQAIWQDRILPNPGEIDRVLQLLITAYSQPDRHYHNLNHIDRMLTTLDRFTSHIQDPISVSLAAWFHDLIYDPQAADNEVHSAKAALKLLDNLGVSTNESDRIQQLILATQWHQIDGVDSDIWILLDADLAILGTDREQYQVYARSIRREYSWVSDDLYREGRIRVLESFLQRDRLYFTDLLFDELEAIARLNIQQEIFSLKTR
jgi:predicted metal-dependent HD superfamily phosphohydrolase